MKTNTIVYIGFVLIGVGVFMKKITRITETLSDYMDSDFIHRFLSGMSLVFLVIGVVFLGFYLGRILEQRMKK